MDDDCPPAKRRNISVENHVDHSEHNKDPTTEGVSNTEVVVEQVCAVNEGQDSITDDMQIEHIDIGQDDSKSENKIVTEEEKLDATRDSLTEDMQIENFDIGQEDSKSKNKIVKEEAKLDATNACGDQIKNEDDSCGDNGGSHSRKKLLVLDINGLLVDIVAGPDEAYKPDTIIGSKAVFKRPFCDEFLKFCFERFSVGVWTSRTRRNIERVLQFLSVDIERQLLFCWDQSHCTDTGFNTVDNIDKPLVLKELKKLWEKEDPNLPWHRGVYNESNTVFLDDSPYKALRNPPYTAIFPYSYSYRNTQDNGLGPDGDLRNYLERLAASDNVQKFIEQNPFGQQPITYDNESWYFYRKIIGPTGPKGRPSPSRRKLIVIDTGGLLVDVSSVVREGFRADTIHGSYAVFKRPYCDEFLQFCFKRFNVGVWTSTSRYNTERTLDFLMGDSRHKLLFCWDRSHCTDTGFSSVENINKTLILKELRKLWQKNDPELPWEIGEYDESNTLLVENTPNKALLNPPHTAIFPFPYWYWNQKDDSLGPKGDLRDYLERLAVSENVQKFVSENPFGQRPIRETNLSWKYYQKVIHAFSSRFKIRAHANGSADAQCKNSSEPKPDTATTALAASTLLEPKADPNTVSAAPTILDPEMGATASDAQTSVESQANTATVLAGPTILEPEIEATTSDAPASLEPQTDTTNVLADQTILGPKIATTTDALTSVEPETGTTVLVAQAILKCETDATTSDAQTSLKPETSSTTTVLAAQTSLEPRTDTTTVSAGPTILEPEIDATTEAQTSVEPEADTKTVLAAPTTLEPQTDTATVSAGPTILEPETDITVLTAPN